MSLSLFVVFEGPDGSGKSTALAETAERLRANGHDVVTTREPGGSDVAEAIRELLFRDEMTAAPVESELLLMTAARVAHLQATINPALDAGKIVLCDRYVDSSYVYQCALGGMDATVLDAINLTLALRMPDLRLFFSLSAEAASKRLLAREESNRFDETNPKRWQKIADAYEDRSRVNTSTVAHIDAEQSIASVSLCCASEIEGRFASRAKL